MADEMTKAAKRRFMDGNFHLKYFVGHGIDIGGKPDPLSKYCKFVFPGMGSVRIWDLEDGDAQYMKGVPDNSFDFLHSSHCLEHLHDPERGLKNWIRIVKSGGYLIITIPDEDMYEGGIFPSRYNPDHKHSFTIYKKTSWCDKSVNVLDLVKAVATQASVERIVLQNAFYNPSDSSDQTNDGRPAECAIEFILRKF